MNHHRLNLDLAADAIINAARRRRRIRLASYSALPLFLINLWIVAPTIQEKSAQGIHAEAPIKSKSTTAGEKFPAAPNQPGFTNPPSTTILESEDELLDALEGFGPVIAQNPDGSSYLILTSTTR